jgi:pantothenate synthetase
MPTPVRFSRTQVVSQDSLLPLTVLNVPAVILVAAKFGSVRLLDNMEIA